VASDDTKRDGAEQRADGELRPERSEDARRVTESTKVTETFYTYQLVGANGEPLAQPRAVPTNAKVTETLITTLVEVVTDEADTGD